MKTYIYVDYYQNRKILWQGDFPEDATLSTADAAFHQATGIDPQKKPNIGVYWITTLPQDKQF